jgi:hypothetical protein
MTAPADRPQAVGRSRGGTAAPLLGVACALLLLGAVAASWVDQPVARSVGDVAVSDTRATAGMELSPLTAVASLAGVVCGLALLLVRGVARQVVALLAGIAGAVAVVAVAVGIARALALDGTVSVAPWVALGAATGMLAAALTGFGRPGRRLPARYDVAADPGDEEWRIAVEPDGVERPGGADPRRGGAS